MILEEKSKIFIISLQYKTLISLNQGQGSIFMLRECAKSIPRLEKPKNRRFSHKNPKMFDFRFNTPIPSLNQGQGSIFKVWECAQSIPRIKLPLRGHLLKNFLTFLFLLSAPPGVVAYKIKYLCFGNDKIDQSIFDKQFFYY